MKHDTDSRIKKTVAFHTLGCKVNQYETQAVLEKFQEAGYEVVCFSSVADVYVVNSCSVTALSDKKTRQMLNRAKKTNPMAVICLMGCGVESLSQEHMVNIDVIVPREKRYAIVSLVEGGNPKPLADTFYDMKISSFSSRTRAFIKIEDGCNRFCSYCIIPYTRGRVRSRSLKDCIDEAYRLKENNFLEIVITGINISAYEYDLIELLTRLDQLDIRLRIGSIEPYAFTPEFINALKSMRNLCPHLHISLQSGSSEILDRMNRKYSPETFMDILNAVKKIPDMSITTDVIVGFPGEGPEQFEQSYDFIKNAGFSGLHAFPYSKRLPTKAAMMENQIPKTVKAERCKRLIELGEQLKIDFYNKFVGRHMNVLIDRKSDSGYFFGYTENYIKIQLDCGPINSVVSARLLPDFKGVMDNEG